MCLLALLLGFLSSIKRPAPVVSSIRHSHYAWIRLGGLTIWRIQCTPGSEEGRTSTIFTKRAPARVEPVPARCCSKNTPGGRAQTVQQSHPIDLPLVREPYVAAGSRPRDRLPHPRPTQHTSSRVGVGFGSHGPRDSDGHHALYKVGRRLEERGCWRRCNQGLTRAALNDYLLAWATSWRRCLRPTSIKCLAQSRPECIGDVCHYHTLAAL